jgi:hypothetical protein
VGDRGGRHEQVHAQVGLGDVPAGRESGLEQRAGVGGLGQDDTIKFDPHAAGRGQNVDTGVGIARVGVDLPVLLEPSATFYLAISVRRGAYQLIPSSVEVERCGQLSFAGVPQHSTVTRDRHRRFLGADAQLPEESGGVLVGVEVEP